MSDRIAFFSLSLTSCIGCDPVTSINRTAKQGEQIEWTKARIWIKVKMACSFLITHSRYHNDIKVAAHINGRNISQRKKLSVIS